MRNRYEPAVTVKRYEPVVIEINAIQELARTVFVDVSEAMIFFVFSFLVFPTWTSAMNDVEHLNVHEQIKTLQSTVNELKNLVHVQSQRNDHLERLLSDNRNEVKELKSQFLNELRNLKSNFSKLDVVVANQNRFLAKLKRDGLNTNRFIHSLTNRQLRLEKMHALVTEDQKELRNLSDGNYSVELIEKKSENSLRHVHKIKSKKNLNMLTMELLECNP